jgi:hypothetical protein
MYYKQFITIIRDTYLFDLLALLSYYLCEVHIYIFIKIT